MILSHLKRSILVFSFFACTCSWSTNFNEEQDINEKQNTCSFTNPFENALTTSFSVPSTIRNNAISDDTEIKKNKKHHSRKHRTKTTKKTKNQYPKEPEYSKDFLFKYVVELESMVDQNREELKAFHHREFLLQQENDVLSRKLHELTLENKSLKEQLSHSSKKKKIKDKK